MSRFYTDKMGIVYYNATITNKFDLAYDSIPAEFSQSFDNALLENTKDYDLCITRFNASSQSIPFWIVPVQLGQPDPELTPYGIQMTYESPDGNVYTTPYNYLLWTNQIVAPQDNGQAILIQNLQNGYYFSYTKLDFVNMFNKALEVAFDALYTGFIAAYPADPNPPTNIGTQFIAGVPNPNFPVLSWNNSLSKFQMYFPVQYFASTYPIEIYVNNLLYPLIQFPSTNSVFNRPNNTNQAFGLETTIDDNYYVPSFYKAYPDLEPIPYIVIYSDHDTTGIFSPLHRIIITSNSLPTSSEIVQPASYPFQSINPSQNINVVNTKIITDFEPDMYSTNVVNRDFIQFNQSVNNSRLISLQNYSDKIVQLDMKVYWSDFNNNIYPLTLYAGCSFDVKVAFVPRIYITSPP
jgi:hypothetical protein